MDIISSVEQKPDVPEISPGARIRVKFKGTESGRERAQVFEGTVIRVRRSGVGSNFTVRQVFHGIGVERTFPLYSPLLDQVEVLRKGKVRRAKLYYLRGLSKKRARLKVRQQG